MFFIPCVSQGELLFDFCCEFGLAVVAFGRPYVHDVVVAAVQYGEVVGCWAFVADKGDISVVEHFPNEWVYFDEVRYYCCCCRGQTACTHANQKRL